MAYIFEDERYEIARAALLVLTWVPTVVIFFCSLCLARRRKDPARSFALPLKFALLFFAASLLFNIIATGAIIATYHVFSYYSSEDVAVTLYRISSQFTAVSRFFDSITTILILLTLVLLATGIAYARKGEAGGFNKIIKFVTYGASVVLFILALAEWALRVKVFVAYYSDDFFSSNGLTDDVVDLWNASRQIYFALVVLFFVVSLAVVALAVLTLIQANSESHLKPSAVLLLVCSVLWLLRTTYQLATQIKYVNPSDIFDDPAYDIWIEVVDVVLYVWPAFILLVILFGLGCQKARGLWTTEQPFVAPNAYGNQSYGNNWQQPTSPMQQQPYYPPQNVPGVPPQHQSYYPPPQHQQQQYQQQPYHYQGSPPPQQQHSYPPTVQSRSPPPHDEAMGFNHQADGTPPQAIAEAYAPAPKH